MFRFFKIKKWFVWSWLGSLIILSSLWVQVKIDVKINEWFGVFYDMIQKALAAPNAITIDEYWANLASFITLFHKDGGLNFIDKAMLKQGLFITDDSRCEYMMNPGGIVWESMNALATAFRQNQTQHIHFIQYDDLVNTPEKALQGIHSFLRMKPFEYDFDNIVAKDREKDKEVYGLETMHEVRPSIKKTSKHYSEVLSQEVINKYINMDFWNR